MIEIEKVRKDLRSLDEKRFENRAKRLKELRENSLTILGKFPARLFKLPPKYNIK